MLVPMPSPPKTCQFPFGFRAFHTRVHRAFHTQTPHVAEKWLYLAFGTIYVGSLYRCISEYNDAVCKVRKQPRRDTIFLKASALSVFAWIRGLYAVPNRLYACLPAYIRTPYLEHLCCLFRLSDTCRDAAALWRTRRKLYKTGYVHNANTFQCLPNI